MPYPTRSRLRAEPRFPQAERPAVVWRLIGRLFFGTACASGVAAALVLALLPTSLAGAVRAALVAVFAAFALLNVWAFRRSAAPRFAVQRGLFGVAALAVGLTSLASLLLGDGIRNPALAYFGLMVCMLCAVAGLRLGGALALLCAAATAGLAGAQGRGLDAPPAGAGSRHWPSTGS
jgi:putative flippase GtrA